MPHTARARGSAAGFASVVPTGGRSTDEPTPTNGRAARRKSNGIDLVDWIGGLPSFGEKRLSGERFPPSFRLGSIKVSTQKPAEPAPQRGRCPSREWLEEIRLEQRWEPGSNILCAPGDRQMVADERAVRRRSSHPRRPRVMRRHPRGWRRSVDRGTGELGIEPRKVEAPGRRRCREKRKATRRAPPWRGARRPCAVRGPMRVRKPSAREPGDLWSARRPRLRAAAGRLRPHAADARTREV